MVFLVNQEVDLKEICLSYPAPEHARLYEEMFHCPVRFLASENQVRVDASFFSLPVCTANQNVYEYCTQFCEEMLRGLKKSDQFIDQVRNIILTSLNRFLKIGEMAKELGISTRSLNRRLQERNTSYKKIMNEVRSDLTKRYLENTNLSIDQISDLIGFAETTAFRKAFKKWTGRSATQHRKEIQARLNNY
jgi:AraC-like DNA-binding protein